jgi:hypothetical protein
MQAALGLPDLPGMAKKVAAQVFMQAVWGFPDLPGMAQKTAARKRSFPVGYPGLCMEYFAKKSPGPLWPGSTKAKAVYGTLC